ncbi:hypothetical protein D3C81_2234060 [compost metagenome]
MYWPAGRAPIATVTWVDAPGWSAPTAAEPTFWPLAVTSSVVAADARSPVFLTVAVSATGVVASGAAGVAPTAVTVRFGLAAGVP